MRRIYLRQSYENPKLFYAWSVAEEGNIEWECKTLCYDSPRDALFALLMNNPHFLGESFKVAPGFPQYADEVEEPKTVPPQPLPLSDWSTDKHVPVQIQVNVDFHQLLKDHGPTATVAILNALQGKPYRKADLDASR